MLRDDKYVYFSRNDLIMIVKHYMNKKEKQNSEISYKYAHINPFHATGHFFQISLHLSSQFVCQAKIH